MAYVRPQYNDKDNKDSKSNKKDDTVKVKPSDNENVTQRYLSLTRRFEFESKLQRMSVLGKNHLNNKNYLFLKGSPEKVKELSVATSIPNNYDAVLEDYTQRGYRVISLAYRSVDIPEDRLPTISRD